jgi:uncharacterized protein (TIGR03083 family)
MNRDDVWRAVDAERAALADLLQTFSVDEWEHPSMCPGWTVRDVAAHVISSPQATAGRVIVAALRAQGNVDRAIYQEAKRSAARPVEQIIADYRRFAGSRRHPIGTSYLDPLVDVLVHTQDIAIPLGREHVMPPAAARVAAEKVWRVPFPFRARHRLDGFCLAATDIDWSAGIGPTVQGPISALLLLLTGRTAGLQQLGGNGAAALGHRLGATA